MKGPMFLTLIFILISYASAGCYLGYPNDDCAYKQYFDFGPNAGDYSITNTDDHYVLIQKPIAFKFFDKYFQSFYISSNGLVKLVEQNDTYMLHDDIDFHHIKQEFPMMNQTLIAPFWTDMTSDLNGGVFYRLVTDKNTLNEVSYEIDRLTQARCDSSYKPSWVAIITWYRMRAFFHPRFANNTFQLIMTTNGEDSYVIFNYGRLQWPNKYTDVSVEAGLNLDDGTKFFRMEGSSTQNITQLVKKSNVNLQSKWLFKIDSHEEFMNQNLKEDKPTEKPARFNVKCKKEEQIKFYLAVLAIASCFYSFVLTCVIIWKNFIKKRQNRIRPRLQMSYHKQLNDSSAALHDNV